MPAIASPINVPAAQLRRSPRQRTTRSSPKRTHSATMASDTATSTDAANIQGS